MIVPKDILVPIDFSETSKTALQWAAGLGQSCNASLHLLHVLESVTTVDPIDISFESRARIDLEALVLFSLSPEALLEAANKSTGAAVPVDRAIQLILYGSPEDQ